jgi:TetR/AcrR family transcriptional repressor of multidrug resistance operon
VRVKDDLKEIMIRKEAIKMIVAHGFDGLSMQKLAKAAKISPSTIYVYFKSREDLVNQLYFEVQQKFENDALQGFDSIMNFEEGLWIQWINRYKNIQENPTEFYFSEQFRNSPLIKHNKSAQSAFRESMNQFFSNAVKNKEIEKLPVEIFWAVAYGAFYILVKFHLDKSTMSGNAFSLSESSLRQTFEIVIKSLKK